MGLREKKDSKGYVVGAEIDDTDPLEGIREHATKQLKGGEQIGAILVQIQTPKKKDLRWLVYTALKRKNGKGRGYKVKTSMDNVPIDKVETITVVHSNPWHYYFGGRWYWIC